MIGKCHPFQDTAAFVPNYDVHPSDSYGFSKVSPYIPIHKVHEFETRYQPMMTNRLYQWDRLLLENGGAWPERSTRRMFQMDEIYFF